MDNLLSKECYFCGLEAVDRAFSLFNSEENSNL
jgi:hypothetical protein